MLRVEQDPNPGTALNKRCRSKCSIVDRIEINLEKKLVLPGIHCLDSF